MKMKSEWLWEMENDMWELEGSRIKVSFSDLPPAIQQRLAVLRVADVLTTIPEYGVKFNSDQAVYMYEVVGTQDEIEELRRVYETVSSMQRRVTR
jgi:hypothetical protein